MVGAEREHVPALKKPRDSTNAELTGAVVQSIRLLPLFPSLPNRTACPNEESNYFSHLNCEKCGGKFFLTLNPYLTDVESLV